MNEITTYVGLDAHKKEIFVAMLVGHDASTPVGWQLKNEPRAIRRLLRHLEREAPGPVVCCYEAGPCGYALQRQLTTPRVTCHVVAPALIPRRPGDRIKTDRRDARKLAQLLRAGMLTAVCAPTPAEEAVRDLCRAREAAREDLLRARHRLGKFLLRRGLMYPGRSWTLAHRAWIEQLAWDQPAERHVIDDYLLALDHVDARLRHLDLRLTEIAGTAPYAEPVGWLRCFRGLDTLSALMLLAELHDFRRFGSPRALMAYVGLVPSEASSGDQTRRRGITKTGNAIVRRLLTEAAWHYRYGPKVGPTLRRRREGQPTRAIAIADRAQHRLCSRFRRLLVRQKPRPLVAIAVARELIGFIWAVLQPPAESAA